MFERETRREKFIESKQREQKTKLQSKLPAKINDFGKKAELATEEMEREFSEFLEMLVSYCDFSFVQ